MGRSCRAGVTLILCCMLVSCVAASYLETPNFNFGGTFFSDPGTLNNFINNYNPKNPIIPWWGPDGLGYFRFVSVNVTNVVDSEGRKGSGDCLSSGTLTTNYNGKIVDLDPDQQFISQLYGVTVTISMPSGFYLTGALEVLELDGLWWKVRDGNLGPSRMSGTWQSVLSNITWSGEPPACSPVLRSLYANSRDALSVRLVVDSYDNNNKSATFHIGRVVGTIGPYHKGEPQQFVAARLVAPLNANYSKAPFIVTDTHLYIDLANSVGLASLKGEPFSPSLTIGVLMGQKVVPLSQGLIDTSTRNYLRTSNQYQIQLAASESQLLHTNPLAILDDNGTLVLQEHVSGKFAYADIRALRLENGDMESVDVWATQFGKPLANEVIQLELVPSPMKPRSDRVNNIPADGLTFPTSIITDANGHAVIQFKANLLGDRLPEPRQYIDSQVYFIQARNTSTSIGMVSVLVFNQHAPVQDPSWTDVFPYFDLYARLFPAMAKIVDLSDKDTVDETAQPILSVMSLPQSDPSYMPVTRDLSASHKQAMVAYLNKQMTLKRTASQERKAFRHRP